MSGLFKILAIGDIMGRPGRRAIRELLPGLIDRFELGLVIANGENAAHGMGITKKIADDLFDLGIDVITSGNHIFRVKETAEFIDEYSNRLLRPANFPPGNPGKGALVMEKSGIRFAVINLHGRVFIKEDYDCPFRKADRLLEEIGNSADVIIIDFHAEASSEKNAFARYLDGRVQAVLGTHTHVQTADEKILKKGTAYITDLGMTGPHDSIIGMRDKEILDRFLYQRLSRFEVAKDDVKLQGIILTLDTSENKINSIERISVDLKN